MLCNSLLRWSVGADVSDRLFSVYIALMICPTHRKSSMWLTAAMPELEVG
jgi:hypothetical protein